MRFVEGIGWLGTASVLAAYALVAWGILAPTSVTIILMNMAGALFLAAPVVVKRVWSLVALNVIWTLIALVALVRCIWGL